MTTIKKVKSRTVCPECLGGGTGDAHIKTKHYVCPTCKGRGSVLFKQEKKIRMKTSVSRYAMNNRQLKNAERFLKSRKWKSYYDDGWMSPYTEIPYDMDTALKIEDVEIISKKR